jgi:hypothetical protein
MCIELHAKHPSSCSHFNEIWRRNVAGSSRKLFSHTQNNFPNHIWKEYVPHSKYCVSPLQTSALQPSLAKPFAEIWSKVVSSLSWFDVVTQMAYGPGEIDMRAICCQQLFTAITTVLEQNKETFVRSAPTDLKIYIYSRNRTICSYTRYYRSQIKCYKLRDILLIDRFVHFSDLVTELFVEKFL